MNLINQSKVQWKKIFFGLSLLLLIQMRLQAMTSGDQGYGLMLGNPTGLSGKLWLDDKTAIDGAFGVDQGELDVHLCVLFHDSQLLKQLKVQPAGSKLKLPVFFGIGPRLLFDNETEVGLRLPAGVSYFPELSDWEFFSELAPVIRLTPSTGLDFDFAIGARYYFLAIRPKK